MSHLPILPILIPLFAGALALYAERSHIAWQRLVSFTSLACLLVVSVMLVLRADQGEILVYLLGDWPARLGIALMVDRLSAMMVLTTALLGIACLLHATSGWDSRAPHFHVLFQFQLAGLNGAFLTGDIFNLFVFFEVMLIASYGLMLSGGRGRRFRAGLHYVTFNIAASTLFLIALGLLYGLVGTLNMAEIAVRVSEASGHDVLLIKATGGLLLVVFCAKAALLPLYLWLPVTYTHAPAAVAALFTIMTKVGIYAVLRVNMLVFGSSAGELSGFAWQWLFPAALATLAVASLGALAALRLRTMIAYLVLASAATLFIAFALSTPETVGAGLYYLPHSTFATAALFLISETIRQRRGKAGDHMDKIAPMPDKTLPATFFLIAAIAVAGLPPLSGFLGKAMLLQSVPGDRTALVFCFILIGSLMVVMALSRAGRRLFWRIEPDAPGARPPKRRPRENLAVVLLLGYGVVMTVAAAPIQRYTHATALQLFAADTYVESLRNATPELRAP